MAQTAGQMVLRYADRTLSDRTLSEAIGTDDSGRKFRLRDDSRADGGFAFPGSVGQHVQDSDDDTTDLLRRSVMRAACRTGAMRRFLM